MSEELEYTGDNYKELIEKAEERISKAFEKWLAEQSREQLEWIIRNIWYYYGILRVNLLPYNEILKRMSEEVNE
jgi:hypothetical protein